MKKQAADQARSLARWATVLISGGGFVVSWYLVEMHVQAKAGQAVGGALCDAHQALDCESAALSSFSELFGFPIALLGLCFYGAMAVLGLLDPKEARSSPKPFRPAAIATTLFFFSVLYSLFLAGVSAFSLHTLCPFCVMLYVVNGVGLVAASLWAGEKPHHVLFAQAKRPGKAVGGWSFLVLATFGFLLLIGAQTVESSVSSRQSEMRSTTTQQQAERIDEALYRVADAPAKGPEDAPVHIVEFSNFPCPFCGRLAGVLHQVEREFEGQVRVEFRHFPLGNQADGQRAARAAYCAGEQERFWPMHDGLFVSAPELGEEQILALADEIGLENSAFQECLSSERAERRVTEDVMAGQRLGIQGTPTFFINGLRVEGAVPLDVMRDLIREELAR